MAMTVTQWLAEQHGLQTTIGKDQECPQCGTTTFQINEENTWARCRSCPFGIDFISRKSTHIKQLLGKDATVITLEDVDLERAKRKEKERSRWSPKKLQAAETWTPLVEVWEVVKKSHWPTPLRFTALAIAFCLESKTGYGWITEQDLASYTGYAKSTVHDYVQLLTEGGEIVVRKPRAYRSTKGKARVGSEKLTGRVQKLFTKGSRITGTGRVVNTYSLIKGTWKKDGDEEE